MWQTQAYAIVSGLSGEENGDWLVMPAIGVGLRRCEVFVIHLQRASSVKGEYGVSYKAAANIFLSLSAGWAQ